MKTDSCELISVCKRERNFFQRLFGLRKEKPITDLKFDDFENLPNKKETFKHRGGGNYW